MSENETQLADEIIKRSRQILNELFENIDKYDKARVTSLLSEFRILTRSKSLTNDLLDRRCLQLLVDCSKAGHPEAQKCLSNLILNYNQVREALVQPYVDCVDSRLKVFIKDSTIVPSKATITGQNSSTRDENTPAQEATVGTVSSSSELCEILYYDLRIIFLLSALCAGSRANIRDRLLESILLLTLSESKNLSKENHLLIIECLKTLFNLTLDKCTNIQLAVQVIKQLFSIVGIDQDQEIDIEDLQHQESGQQRQLDPTDQMLVNLIHLLTNMPEKVYHELSDDDVDKVLQHLDEQLKSFTNRGSFRDTVLPVLNACANICKYKEDVRKRWFKEIIESTTDFKERPEECNTLRGRIVRLMTSVDVHLKDIAAEFIYALCGKDVEKLITYTGFGNSAAYLATRGLLSQSARRSMQQSDDSTESRIHEVNDSEDVERGDKSTNGKNQPQARLNPITGRLEGPKRSPMEGMSEEEKEWHAHELANAISKLTRLGVMKPMSVNENGQTVELNPESNQATQTKSQTKPE